MTELKGIIDEDIEVLESELIAVKKAGLVNRYGVITHAMEDGTLQIDDSFSEDELMFVHSKLHMIYYQNDPQLSQERVQEIHKEIKDRLTNHWNIDNLDEN